MSHCYVLSGSSLSKRDEQLIGKQLVKTSISVAIYSDARLLW